MAGAEQSARQRGIALISVLWVGVVLGALAAAVMALGRGDLDLAQSQRAQAEAELAADSAARAAIYALVNRAEGPIAIDGSVAAWRIGDAEVRVEISSEHGRIDLNRADPELIAAVLAEAGAGASEAERLAAAIADFTDGDDALSPSGVERPDYRAAGLSGPKNAPIERESEVLGVLGMTAGLYRRVEGALTVHSHRPRPREGQQPPLVAAALGGNPGPATEPLPPAFSLDLAATPVALRAGSGAANSDLLRIRAESVTLAGARAARIAVVSLRIRRGNAYSVLDWRRGSPELFPPRPGTAAAGEPEPRSSG